MKLDKKRKGIDMTYDELLELLKSIKEHSHSSMDNTVTVLFDNSAYEVEIAENLITGDLIFYPKQLGGEDE